jgi:tRNA (guanine37-N1)-methyltransferase
MSKKQVRIGMDLTNQPKSLAEFVKNVLKKENMLSSYDIIGSIALIEIPYDLKKYQKEIAEFLMKKNKNIKSVAIRSSPTKGKYRIRKIKIIAGEKTSKTIAIESGCRFIVDLNKAYYSNRFSEERLRIAKQIKKNENILVPFAGVCPYPIIIEKKSNPKKIIAIEINKNAFKLGKKNIEINKCKKIEFINADAKKELKKLRYTNFANRIIMPHPTEAEDFFPLIIKTAKKNAIIHLYLFKNKKEKIEQIIQRLNKKISKKSLRAKLKLLNYKIVRPYSKDLDQIVLDIKIIKH